MTTNYDFDKKVRKSWNINPGTKIRESKKKKYNRKKNKKETKNIIKEL